jgi:hypothetical protein
MEPKEGRPVGLEIRSRATGRKAEEEDREDTEHEYNPYVTRQ